MYPSIFIFLGMRDLTRKQYGFSWMDCLEDGLEDFGEDSGTRGEWRRNPYVSEDMMMRCGLQGLSC
jgi:hypothetical protein